MPANCLIVVMTAALLIGLVAKGVGSLSHDLAADATATNAATSLLR